MRERTNTKAQWRTKVRSLFREKIQEKLQKQYDFYARPQKVKLTLLNLSNTTFKRCWKGIQALIKRLFLLPALDKEDPTRITTKYLQL